MAKCSSCQAPILWVINIATGKSIPLNAQADPAGRAIIVDREQSGQTRPKCRFLKNGDPVPENTRTFTSHFASCPEADKHRKTRDGARTLFEAGNGS